MFNFTIAQLIKSKTVIVNVVVGLLMLAANLGWLTADIGASDISALVDQFILLLQDYEGLVMIGTNIVMRAITKEPLSEK